MKNILLTTLVVFALILHSCKGPEILSTTNQADPNSRVVTTTQEVTTTKPDGTVIVTKTTTISEPSGELASNVTEKKPEVEVKPGSGGTSPATETKPITGTKPLVDKPNIDPGKVTPPTETSGRGVSPKADYLSAREQEMVNEINLLRGNPKGYIPYITAYKQKLQTMEFQGNFAQREAQAADELIRELNNLAPLSILKLHPKLHQAAKLHGEEMKSRGYSGHIGKDGSYPWDRIKRLDPALKDGNENLVGGPKSIREAVILLLVDSGIPDRGHRKTLLQKDWEYVACSEVGTVAGIPNYWVQNFAKTSPLQPVSAGGGTTPPTTNTKPPTTIVNTKPPTSQPSTKPDTDPFPITGGSGTNPLTETEKPATSEPSTTTEKPATNSGGSGGQTTGGTGEGYLAGVPMEDRKYDTGKSASYLKEREKEMLLEINRARNNPKLYARYIEEYKVKIEKYNKTGLGYADDMKAIGELLQELNTMQPAGVLQSKETLYKAAMKHGLEMKARGKSGHVGNDGSYPWDRILREDSAFTDGNENLVGGPKTVREAVILLLVDSGIPSRGHRKTMLNPEWKYGACFEAGKVGSMPNSWVQNYAK